MFYRHERGIGLRRETRPIDNTNDEINRAGMAIAGAGSKARKNVYNGFPIRYLSLFRRDVRNFVIGHELVFLRSVKNRHQFSLRRARTSTRYVISRNRTTINDVRRASGMRVFQSVRKRPIVNRYSLFTPVITFGRRRRLTRSLTRITPISLVSRRGMFSIKIIKDLLTRTMGCALYRLRTKTIQPMTRRSVLMKMVLIRLGGLGPKKVDLARCEMHRPFNDVNLSGTKYALRGSVFLIT